MNAMALDIAMGGSTNTVLHLLAIAREADVDFRCPTSTGCRGRYRCCAKSLPVPRYHLEDVSRAGGIMAILGELDRAGLIDPSVKRVDAPNLQSVLESYDIASPTATEEARKLYLSAPGAKGRNLVLASQEAYYPELGSRSDIRMHPRHRSLLFQGRRIGRAFRQSCAAGMHREDRGSGRIHFPFYREARACMIRRKRLAKAFWAEK